MFRKTVGYFMLPLLLLLSDSSGNSAPQSSGKGLESQTGTREKLIVGSGRVIMDLDLDRLQGIRSETQESKRDSVRFEVAPNSFFTILVFNNELRGPQPGTMELISGNSTILPAPLNASVDHLVIEKIPSGGPFDLVVRDRETGFVFFDVEGDLFEYDAAAHLLSMKGARLLISEGLANKLGRPADAGVIVGGISIATTMYPIEITTVVNGAAKSSILPPRRGRAPNAPEGRVSGPDIVVGYLPSMIQAGSNGGQVGLGIATTSCNNGDRQVNFFALPDTRHSVVSQNLYRMSGGTSNNDRFEQIGQGWAKHTFGADQDDDCGFGCTPAGDFSHLGVGCSDPYDAGENAIYSLLGSRAWVNPFTGAFPSNAANHSGHAHTGTSHRLLVNASDLDTTMNPGATYYAEVTYDIGQEYDWCQGAPGQCNMYNNATYRRFNVSGTTGHFSFSGVGSAVRMTPVIDAWTGATTNMIEPEPGVDGRAFIVYKVTNPSAGVWHYEYAIYNRNLDRAIQSFSVPLGCGITVSNLGFHAPLNPAGFANDGTQNNAGFSNTVWTSNQTSDALTWNSETFAQSQNANAIRWGTLYNFRFDSDRPPQITNATIGFFKTGTPITVGIQGPTACNATPTPTPTPSPTPPGTAQAINLSTRMQVETGDNVGIGGFIISGAAAKHVLLRAIGPSLAQSGVPNVLADPVLELHGAGAFATITDDNWRDDPAQEAAILATGIPPADNLESAIDATLNPGAYTAVVSGKNNTSGVALVEVYDFSQATVAKLANISTRAFVGTGDDVVIAGFILGSHRDNDWIAVRGIGPTLTAAGVPNALADPTLELRDSNGVLFASNNDWQDNPAQAAELAAAGLAPTNPLESGMVATLPAGVYTALLSGVNNGTGIGLVEVYDLGTP